MAIAVTLREFNDLGRSVTPIFLSMGHFLYRYATYCEKTEESLLSRSLNFILNTSLRVKVCENVGNI